jgi:predicted dinucleotide-binding enzyme
MKIAVIGKGNIGDATATQTVDALLPLWFALVKQNSGDRKVALRIVR